MKRKHVLSQSLFAIIVAIACISHARAADPIAVGAHRAAASESWLIDVTANVRADNSMPAGGAMRP